MFRALDIPDDHIEIRDEELFRMFSDVGCRWEFDAIEGASMWDAFTAQRAEAVSYTHLTLPTIYSV